MTEWTSVKERLPAEHDVVPAILKNGDRCYVIYTKNKGFYFVCYDSVYKKKMYANPKIYDNEIDVTYWLQLPEPPSQRTMPFGKHVGKKLSDVPYDYVCWLDRTGSLIKHDTENNDDLRKEFQDLGIL